MKEDKRERIRDAAISVFAEKGFSEARADEIAERAGVAVGTIYNYFANKEAILIDIFEAEFTRLKEFYQHLRRSGLPVVEQIRQILKEHFARLEERQELIRVLQRERFKLLEHPGAEPLELYREIVAYVEELLREGIENGLLRECNPRIIAHALFGAVESVTHCSMICSPEESQQLFREAPEELAKFIWRGITLEGG
ncbi:MAG: TetR/AcrR family transcriptional regulator [Candidatus Acetothermia bacterium]|jgi:TetR/AcrR family fatty acid metabolism transcriptional regulator|nr:TetR/AcrR family transcriptional regulator [Candidatus Acetothermia bacterium]